MGAACTCAAGDEQLAAIPRDTVAVVLVDTHAWGDDTATGITLAGIIAEHAAQMGLLSGLDFKTRLWLEALANWPTLTAQPFAIVLTDIEASAVGEGHRLARLQAGLVATGEPAGARIAQRIQQLLNRYTNDDVARIEPHHPNDPQRFRLTDARLPDWAACEWGPIGRNYIVTVGRDAFDQFAIAARDPHSSMMHSDSFQNASRPLDPKKAAALWYVDFERLRSSLAPALADLTDPVLQKLGFANTRRALWTLTRDGPALRIDAVYHVADQFHRTAVSRTLNDAERRENIIPPEANLYMVVPWNPSAVFRSILDGYLASRSPSASVELRRRLAQFEQSLDLSLERDLLYQLDHRLCTPGRHTHSASTSSAPSRSKSAVHSTPSARPSTSS